MKKKIVIAVIIVLLAIGGYATVQNREKQTSEVTIGIIAGTTGEYSFVGENLVKGIQIAQDDWNSAHPEQPVRIIIEDDGFDAAKGIAAYKKLTTLDNVDAIGNMTSVTIDAIYSDVVSSGIPLVQTGEQGIDPKDDNVFQVLEGNIATEKALGEYVQNAGFKKVAVFVSNNATFERFYNGFSEGYGGEHTVYRVNPNDATLKTQVLKAVSEKPDAVVVIMMPPDGATVAREINTQGNIPMFFDVNIHSGWTEYEKILGDTTVLNGDTVVTLKQSNTSPAFVAAYKTKFGEEPGIGSTWGYDTLTFLLNTMEDPEDYASWVANMKTKKVESIGGIIEFDEVGVRLPKFSIGTVSEGKLPTE